MLSSVLRSDRAVKVNTAIMRAFVRLRELLALRKDISRKIDALEQKDAEHDSRRRIVFETIRELAKETPKRRRRIGFKPEP